MSIVYRCDSCGKEREELSDSWSEIEVADTSAGRHRYPLLLHHCLECRSDKKEWREPVQRR